MIVNIVRKVFSKFHIKKIIIFESFPDCSDSTLSVYNDLKKRELDKKFTFVWQLESYNEDLINKLKTNKTKFYFAHPKNFKERILLSYYRHNADLILFSNNFVIKYFETQKALYLTHGIALKDISKSYYLPHYLSDSYVLTLSESLYDTTSTAFHCRKDRLLPLGLPRNDELFDNSVNLKQIFCDKQFDKVIYWLPTFRQHNIGESVSNISIPVIHNIEKCKEINDFANKNGVLIIVKPHFAQDLSHIKSVNYSNILFINEEFLDDYCISNYQLLGNCDALLTDYSSVFYDFLLCDKPIGLCWEDFDEYSKNNGFMDGAVDIMKSCCDIINDSTDLKSFIERLSLNQDIKKSLRESTSSYVHKFLDNNSTERVVDYILKELL